jgi:hypothetical protein
MIGVELLGKRFGDDWMNKLAIKLIETDIRMKEQRVLLKAVKGE